MSLKVLKVLLILSLYISTTVICFENNKAKVTTTSVGELSEGNSYVEEHGYEKKTDDFISYCIINFQIQYIFLKYRCNPHLESFTSNTEQILLDSNTNSPLARCIRENSDSNSTTFSCVKESYDYCGEVWQNIWITYHNSRSYFLGIICFLGCLTNIINFIVLTRKNMINPINIILAVIAVSDFLFSMFALVFSSLVIHRKIFGDKRTYKQLELETQLDWIFYIFHTLSLYLTALVAGWKCFGIKFPLKSKTLLTNRNAKLSTLYISIGLVLYGAAIFFFLLGGYENMEDDPEKIEAFLENEKFPDILYYKVNSEYYKLINTILTFNEKWLPCLLSTIFTIGLMLNLIHTNKYWRRQSMSSAKICRNNNSNTTNDKTNKMLLMFLIIFLVTELPVGIYLFAEALMEEEPFHIECNAPLYDLLTDFEYLSCVTSFFVYVTMSTVFRTTLLTIYKDIGGKFLFQERNSKGPSAPMELANVTANASS